LGKRKLNVRFHNPNSTKDTTEHIGKIFVQAGRVKFEKTLKEQPALEKSIFEHATPRCR